MNEYPETLCKPEGIKWALKACFEVAEVLGSAVLAIAILFTFVLRFAGVVGASMEPTLQHQDWLAITAYANPRAGQVVIISPRDNTFNEPLVKRVIAVAGDTIDIREDRHVYVNGTAIFEPYLLTSASTVPVPADVGGLTFPLLVPAGYVFVLGDNREGSTDSRNESIGLVRVDDILGRVMLRVRPNPRAGFSE